MNRFRTELLAEKMQKHGAQAWMVNTGWSGGKYGVGKRMNLNITRKIIDNIHNGELLGTEYKNMPIFNLNIPVSCTGINSEILDPIKTWHNKDDYNKTLQNLAIKFQQQSATHWLSRGYIRPDVA